MYLDRPLVAHNPQIKFKSLKYDFHEQKYETL